MDGQDRVKQRPVSRSSVQCPHGGGQRFDKTFVLQPGYVFPYRVRAHAYACPDFPKARVAQVGFPVLAKNQVGVHGDFSCAQSQGEDLVGQKEKSSMPWFSLASPSHIFLAGLLPVFQISFCEAFSLFYAAQFLRGGTPLLPDKQKAGIAPGPWIIIQLILALHPVSLNTSGKAFSPLDFLGLSDYNAG